MIPVPLAGNAECACKEHIASQNRVILPVFTTAAGNAAGGLSVSQVHEAVEWGCVHRALTDMEGCVHIAPCSQLLICAVVRQHKGLRSVRECFAHVSALPLSSRHRHCRWMGLWRVAVMEVEVVLRYGPRFQQPNGRATAGREERLLRLLVGDTSGARSQLSVPYQKRRDSCGHSSPIIYECTSVLPALGQIAEQSQIPGSALAIALSTSAIVSARSVHAMHSGIEVVSSLAEQV